MLPVANNASSISSKAFTDDVLMPCEDPRFMLALRLADSPQSSQVKIVTLTDQQILDPQRYLTSVLAKIGQTPTAELDQFLPDVWKRD